MIGHIPNLSNEAYHAAEGISKSQLDAIHISPLNYWDRYLNPNREPQEDKHCFLIGGATHAIVLEPELFKEQYAVGFDKSLYPDALDTLEDLKEAAKNAGLKVSGTKSQLIQRLYDAKVDVDVMMKRETDHILSHRGKMFIPAMDYKNMLASLEAINKHHTAGSLIKGASVEQSYFSKDEYGFTRKVRPDAISGNGQIVIDLKSTQDVSLDGFGRSVGKFRYHVQGAYYLDTLKLVMGEDAPKIFSFIAAQKNRPYDVSVQFLTEEQIQWGRRLYQKDYELLRDCLDRDYWPGSDGGNVLEVQLPKWEKNYNE